jgi:hypothetical protein
MIFLLIISTARPITYLILSKVNERQLSIYKYLYLKKFLTTTTEVVWRRRRALTDVLIFAISKIL